MKPLNFMFRTKKEISLPNEERAKTSVVHSLDWCVRPRPLIQVIQWNRSPAELQPPVESALKIVRRSRVHEGFCPNDVDVRANNLNTKQKNTSAT